MFQSILWQTGVNYIYQQFDSRRIGMFPKRVVRSDPLRAHNLCGNTHRSDWSGLQSLPSGIIIDELWWIYLQKLFCKSKSLKTPTLYLLVLAYLGEQNLDSRNYFRFNNRPALCSVFHRRRVGNISSIWNSVPRMALLCNVFVWN